MNSLLLRFWCTLFDHTTCLILFPRFYLKQENFSATIDFLCTEKQLASTSVHFSDHSVIFFHFEAMYFTLQPRRLIDRWSIHQSLLAEPKREHSTSGKLNHSVWAGKVVVNQTGLLIAIFCIFTNHMWSEWIDKIKIDSASLKHQSLHQRNEKLTNLSIHQFWTCLSRSQTGK